MLGWFLRAAQGFLPPALQGWLEFRLGRHEVFYPWGGAFNNQTVRRELCRRIIRFLKPDLIVETGTHRGTTTAFLAEFGAPVISIESDPKFFAFAKARLAAFANVTLHHGKSHGVLAGLLRDAKPQALFAYLDAHWEDEFPLREEIEQIARQTPAFVIVMDDFEVPQDREYGFDDYGAKGACRLSFIQPSLTSDMAVYFPAVPAREETGVKRGYCFLARGQAVIERLDSFPELLRHLPATC